MTAPDAPVALPSMEERVSALESAMTHNTALTQTAADVARQNNDVLVDVRTILEACKRGLKVLGWIGTAVFHVGKWIGIVAGACAAVLGLYHGLHTK